MQTKTRPATQESQLIDILDVAKLLDCSRNHVANLDKRGALPRPVRIGRLKKWRRSEIDAWIAAGAPNRNRWESRPKPRRSVKTPPEDGTL